MFNLNILTLTKFPQIIKKLPILQLSFFILFFSVFLTLSIKLMAGPDFNDETEKYVVAQLLLENHKIYSDIFVNHGPVVYFLSHIFHSLFGFHGLLYPRVIPVLISIFSVISILNCSAIHFYRNRLLAASIYILILISILTFLPLVMTMYQVYVGYFFVSIISLFVIPLYFNSAITNLNSFISGFFSAAVIFSAISFIPAILLVLFIAVISYFLADNKKKVNLKKIYLFFTLGFFFLVSVISFWLFKYGDFKGFFIDHVYFNLKVYSKYLASFSYFGPFGMLSLHLSKYLFFNYKQLTSPLFLAMPLILSIYFFVLKFNFKKFVFVRNLKLLPLYLCVILFMIYLNPRASGNFSMSSFAIPIACLFSILFVIIYENRGNYPSFIFPVNFLILFSFFLILIIAQFTDRTTLYEQKLIKYYSMRGPLDMQLSQEMNEIRRFTNSNEGILVLPYSPNVYIWAARKPSHGIFGWSPWQYSYTSNYFNGYEFNLCADIKKSPPKAIVNLNTALWENDPNIFMGCINSFVQKNYLRSIYGDHLWVRKDLVANKNLFNDFLEFNYLESPKERLPLNHNNSSEVYLGVFNFMNIKKENIFLKQDSDNYRILSSTNQMQDDLFCIESKFAEKQGLIPRKWRCQKSSAHQLYSKLNAGSNFKLKNLATGFCLDFIENHLLFKDCKEASFWQPKLRLPE